MKRGILTLVAVIAMGSASLAQDVKVLVAPFEGLGPEQQNKAWVARALQQNLMAELGRVASVKAVAGTAALSDAEAALRAAQAAGAKYVVFGSYQSVESDLRLTGQVLEVEKKQAVAGLKATGTLRDLFGLEDTIAAQVKRALPQAQAQAQAQAAAPAPAGAAAGDMLEQPRPAGVAPGAAPAIAPRGPVEFGRAARAADELADEMERAIERIRYRNTWNEDVDYDRPYYRRPYYGYGYGYRYPYYGGYPIYWTGPVYVPPGGGIIGKSPSSQRYPGHTEFGQPRLSFPNFTPDGNFHKNKR